MGYQSLNSGDIESIRDAKTDEMLKELYLLVGAAEDFVSQKTFQDVASLVASDSIALYDAVSTLGYDAIGDTGENLYVIVPGGTGVQDYGTFIDLDSGFQAFGLFPKGVISPKQFGASTAGADSYARIQACLDFASTSKLPIDCYGNQFASGTTLELKSNTRFIGSGGLTAHASLPTADALLQMDVMSGTLGTYYNQNISFEGVTFDGNNRTLTDGSRTALIKIWSTQAPIFKNCVFKNHQYILLSLGGDKDATVESCEFVNWGLNAPLVEGGPAIWTGPNPTDDTIGDGVTVDTCHFHDSEWCAMYALIRNVIFTNNLVRNIKEGAIYSRFGTYSGIETDGYRHVYSNNVIDGVTLKVVQAAGFEIGSHDTVVTGNIIKNCDRAGIIATDQTITCIIANNIVRDCCLNQPDAAAFGQISVRATSSAGVLQDVTVCNNIVRGSVALYGIRIYRESGTDIPDNINICDNDVSDSGVTANLSYTMELGNNCSVRNNIGHASENPVSGILSMTAAGGTHVITGVGFPPRRIEFHTAFHGAGGVLYTGHGVSNKDDTHSAVFSTIDHTAGAALTGNSAVNSIVLKTTGGVTNVAAKVSAFGLDGFTVSKANFVTTATVHWTAYP